MQNKRYNRQKIYEYLLLLYPKTFRQMYGKEMGQVFQDLYQENNKLFWQKILIDTCINATIQHISLSQKEGVKKYLENELNINTYNIVGCLLILPFFSMLLFDAITRIIQGNLSYPNPIVYQIISHTIFYNPPALFLWAIVFPITAAIINILALIPKIQKSNGNILSINFLKTTMPTIAIICIGLGFFTIIIGHDFIPCLINNLLRTGIKQFPQIIQVCRKA